MAYYGFRINREWENGQAGQIILKTKKMKYISYNNVLHCIIFEKKRFNLHFENI